MAGAFRTGAALAVAHAAVILLFLRGFLLTRVELPHTSACAPTGCTHQQYDRAVVLIVDALRYDFVCAPRDQPAKSHQGLLPRTLGLMQRAVRPPPPPLPPPPRARLLSPPGCPTRCRGLVCQACSGFRGGAATTTGQHG